MEEEYQESTENRLEHVVSDIIAMGDPDDMMLAITETLTDTEIVPDVGMTYVLFHIKVLR